MENPATWNDDTKAVAAAIDHHSNQMTQGIIGLSVMATIEMLVIRPLREQLVAMTVELKRLRTELETANAKNDFWREQLAVRECPDCGWMPGERTALDQGVAGDPDPEAEPL